MALTATQVHQFYVGYYGRPADTAGLTYWQAQTEAAALTGFSGGAEFTSQYAGLSTTAQVTKVYANLLGRAPDAGGLAYWSGELTAGRETIGSLLLTVIKSALGKDVTTIADRVQYSTDFAAALDTLPEINAYNGAAANALARTAMGAIVATAVDDHASLTTAAAAINATIVTIVTTGVTGSTFALTNSSTADVISSTAGNDTITSTPGTMATGDLIVDPSTTDSDIGNFTVNSYTAASVQPTISNVETINAIGAYTATGLDMANVTGVKTINLTAGIAGGTGSVDGATITKLATGVVAGTNIGTLNVNTATFTNGTGGNITVDRGAAALVTIGATGNTGADTFTVSSLANGTVALLGGSSGGTDTFTVNLVGAASTLTVTNASAAAGDINVLNLNSNTSANTVTLGTTHDLAGNASTDKVLVGGTQALTIVGSGDAIANTAATTSVLLSKSAGAGTVTFANNVAMTAGQVFINRFAADVFEVRTDAAVDLTVNDNTTVKQVGALTAAARAWDVGNTTTAGTIGAGVGTLKFELAGSSATNSVVAGITTGAAVGTLVLTNNTIDSTITVLDIATTAVSTGNTVVVSGTKSLTIPTLTNDASETLVATNLSGNLVIGGTSVAAAVTIIGGSGNDTITGSTSADSLVGGAGNDVINGGTGGNANTITGGLGNDTIVLTGTSANADTITDFSTTGTNGTDVIALSVSGLTTAPYSLLSDGNSAAVVAGTTTKSVLVSAAKALVAGENIVVVSGTFSSATLLTAVNSGGSRQLTFASTNSANDDIVVVWTDGTNGHVGIVNDTVGGLTIAATSTYTELATLTGITSVDSFISGNFQFVV